MSCVPSICTSSGCPQAPLAKGFALHSGIPSQVRMCVLLETPGRDEPPFMVKDLHNGTQEMGFRKFRYPELEDKFVRLGAPVVGAAGFLLWNWLMRPMGLQRSDVALFNVLCCLPPKTPKGEVAYPKGDVRKRAEATCQTLWMQPLVEWDPEVAVVAMHPSALGRDIVPLPVVLRAIEKAKVFALDGKRVLLLMGGKAAKAWLGYGENTTRWCGHWQEETLFTRSARETRRQKGMEMKVGKKVKKLNAKSALAMLLAGAEPYSGGDIPNGMWVNCKVTREQFDEMVALTVTKPRSKKEKPSAS